MIRVATWNIEHFNRYFNSDNSLKTTEDAQKKFGAIAEIMKEHLKADIIGITEAPNTTTSSGNQDGVAKLENFAAAHGLTTRKGLIGYISRGSQELIFLYDPDKMSLSHEPEGSTSSKKKNPRFDLEFQYDTDYDKILEIYTHYRPPLEAKVTLTNGEELWFMLVHAKSKGIFNIVDQIHLERTNRRNRLKLYGETTWIRQRIDSWFDKDRKIIVMGDINDGPGMDIFEMVHGISAVETIMGDIFYPERILKNYLGRPQFRTYGWTPSSARFTDRITEDPINVLIDHILLSQNIPVVPNSARVWNPYEAKNDPIQEKKELFMTASDHFPVSIDLDF